MDSNLKYVGFAGVKKHWSKNGVKELQQSAMVVYGIAKLITRTVSKTLESMKKALLAEWKRKLKVVESQKMAALNTAKATVL